MIFQHLSYLGAPFFRKPFPSFWKPSPCSSFHLPSWLTSRPLWRFVSPPSQFVSFSSVASSASPSSSPSPPTVGEAEPACPTHLHHQPVLLRSISSLLTDHLKERNKQPVVFVDGTVGAGGHSKEIITQLTPGRLRYLGVDRDPAAVALARAHVLPLFAQCPSNGEIVQAKFSQIPKLVEEKGLPKIDSLLLDLGVSSMQLNSADRGFSFSKEGPLDMRMSQKGESMLDIVSKLSEDEIATILSTYGEEKYAANIARFIKAYLQQGKLQTTADLQKICGRVYLHAETWIREKARANGQKASIHRMDPATRTFQALRIYVNDEMRELGLLLRTLPGIVAEGGRVGIISFHSLEDRMVKRAFRIWKDMGIVDLIPSRKAVTPSAEEVSSNPRSRSAKLRVCEFTSKIADEELLRTLPAASQREEAADVPDDDD